MTMHLAQLNIGRLKGGKDDPRMVDFFANLDRINAVAERMPGFVWRLKDETNNATAMTAPGDETVAVNLTVWESAETLEKFVWQTAHAKIYARKHEWFEDAVRARIRDVVDRRRPRAHARRSASPPRPLHGEWRQRVRVRMVRSSFGETLAKKRCA